MYKVKYLQEELTSLFRTRILEDGNPAEDAMDYLGNIDFHALTQAVQDKARTAYTYQRRLPSDYLRGGLESLRGNS